MKTIFACVDPANYFKIEISDTLWQDMVRATDFFKGCPFDGRLWLPINILNIKTRRYTAMRVIISNERGKIRGGVYEFPYQDIDLLEYDDNLLTLPYPYVTRLFRIIQEEAAKYLNLDELGLVSSWEKSHAKTLTEN